MPRPTKPARPPKELFEAALFKRLDRIAAAIQNVANEIHFHATPGSGDVGAQQKIDDAAKEIDTVAAELATDTPAQPVKP